jgi:hypothetical protein
MSLTKLSLAGNNLIIPGQEKIAKLFLQCTVLTEYGESTAGHVPPVELPGNVDRVGGLRHDALQGHRAALSHIDVRPAHYLHLR